FMATAVGFALVGSTGDIFLIFAALGLGLAAPYLLVAAWPQLAAHLPRPGRWMLALKILLGFAMAGTAIWLLYALAGQIGRVASLVTGAALLMVVLFLALRRFAPRSRNRPLPGEFRSLRHSLQCGLWSPRPTGPALAGGAERRRAARGRRPGRRRLRSALRRGNVAKYAGVADRVSRRLTGAG